MEKKEFIIIVLLFILISIIVSLNKEKILFNCKVYIWDMFTDKYDNETINVFGYRNDCTGFVGWMWGLPKDLGDKNGYEGGPRIMNGVVEKHNFKYYVNKTTKENLKMGDVISLNDQHVILFYKWLNKEKTKYVGFEYANIPCSRGFRRIEMKFPYSDCIRPYNFNYELYKKKQ